MEREPAADIDGAWAPGCIREFHSYAHQDHNEHANADTHAALAAGHTREAVVGVVRQLKEARGTRDWDRMRTVLLAAFVICEGQEDQEAGAGRDYALPEINPATPE